MKLVAIDPGDVYCGISYFEKVGLIAKTNGWVCVDAEERTPDEMLDGLAEALIDGEFDYIVYEGFWLAGGLALAQSGSEMLTSQAIGAIRWMTRKHNEHANAHMITEDQGKMMTCELAGGTCENRTPQPVRVIKQQPAIQGPTRNILRAKKIKSVARPIARAKYHGRDHVISAELHGWHAILNGLTPHG